MEILKYINRNYFYIWKPNGDRLYENKKIRLTRIQVAVLEGLPLTANYDAIYVGNLLLTVFGRDTLLMSSTTGQAKCD